MILVGNENSWPGVDAAAEGKPGQGSSAAGVIPAPVLPLQPLPAVQNNKKWFEHLCVRYKIL